MKLYLFIRVFVPLLAMAGWVLFQLLVKKKQFSEIEGDVKIIAFFIGVWIAIYFLFLR